MTSRGDDGRRPEAQEVPMSGAAELVLSQLRSRREELDAHNPEALRLAAAGLAAMHDAAYRHGPEIRADRQVRYRIMQLMGEKGLPFEDVAAIALEGGSIGAEVVRAGLRVILAALGDQVTSAVPPAAEIVDTAAGAMERSGALGAKLSRAMANDGEIDAAEATDALPTARRLKADAVALEATLTRAAGVVPGLRVVRGEDKR